MGLLVPPWPPSVVCDRLPDRLRGRSEGKPSSSGGGSPGACSVREKVSVRAFPEGFRRGVDWEVRLSLRQAAVG